MLPFDLLDDPLQRPTSFSWGRPSTRRTQHSSTAELSYSTTPVVRGIPLVSTHNLPDRFRNIFFLLFNAIQSKCFGRIYNSDDNFVLSSPTGSGKTVVFELAICRLINACQDGTFKIVYQAPTKSLCAERQRDWQDKFRALNLEVAELTGDVQNAQLKNVQHATIIITTPEKWDSITRKWKDHKKLMQMVKLFLIDEVHTLKEDRGAVLEVVVSRMKSVGAGVRFIALSATIPNIQDISAWLGRRPDQQQSPALQETFGEEFRPVQITKYVCGYNNRGNDFAFDKTLSERLPEVITKHSQGKPILIFCFTRAACMETAKYLTQWLSTMPRNRQWEASKLRPENKDLQSTIRAGVAFHHAGLSAADRTLVEQGYLAGNIHVICCTSTLAAGVNLPCHMVIIKNTVTYTTVGCKEYSDLEVMQMLGRAGRPQFGTSAIAVIMTRQQQVLHYERLVTGQETIESRLHLNLIDHLNAEIGLGTIHNETSATAWLCSTFLYIRLQQHPQHYKLSSDKANQLDEHLKMICRNGVELLQQHNLITNSTELHATAFGDVMSRYCVQFETMQTLLSLKRGARMSELLTCIAQAAEFKEIYFRSGEKNIYRQWNSNPLIKFPLKIHIDAPWHKVFLLLQVVLAGNELPDAHREQRQEFNSSKIVVLQHALRLTRCICECMIYLRDATATRNALALARSLSAHIWDDSTLHMSQLDGLGMAGVRRLVKGGVRTMEDLANAEPHRLEQILTRNPPHGTQLRDKAVAFPRLSVDLQAAGRPDIKAGDCIALPVAVKMTFLNETSPTTYQRRALQLCLLIDTPSGQLLHFSRFSAVQALKEPDRIITVRLADFTEILRVQFMCDDYAGTARSATLKLRIPESTFTAAKLSSCNTAEDPNSTLRPPKPATSEHHPSTLEEQAHEFDDDAIRDDDFLAISDVERPLQHGSDDQDNVTAAEPVRLDNGRWSCRHSCKDKTTCKHLCCREGLDKKPKMTKSKSSAVEKPEKKSDMQQSQLKITRKRSAGGTNQTSLTQVVTRSPRFSDLDMRQSFQDFQPSQQWKTIDHFDIDLLGTDTLEDEIPSTDPLIPIPISSEHGDAALSSLNHNNVKNTGHTIDPSQCQASDVAGCSQPDHHSTNPSSNHKKHSSSTPEAFDIVRQFLGDKLFNYIE
ncbi:hypothetical protein AMS68_004928 [Peltaster fructicola]|uniref:DNA 3'-5' helicase n=1 Tax=Peltaster fructicola TaxID=286661 RepID=A0A6H0XXM0_9PEZI|nr:hypothetical protein AMS68_004928 [Peltaster fructicola]